MSKFTKVLAVLVILSFVVANAQADFEDAPQGDFGDDGEFQRTNVEEETTIQRNKLIACIVLSRHVFNDINNELSATLRQHSASQSLYKKMLGDFMLHCFFTVTVEESTKFFEVIQNKELNLAEWEHLHNFNLDRYKGEDLELELSPEQERLVELVEEFDKQMRDKYGEQAPDADDSDQDYYSKKNIDIEPKIGGLSLKNTGTSFRLAYVAIIVAIIGGGLFFALKKLFTPELTPYEKVKMQKQERKNRVSQSPTKKAQ
jgi:hypothetical protein